MPARVSLDKIVEAMESQGDEIRSYVNRDTGEVATVTDEEMRAAEDGDDLTDYPDWEVQAIEKAREVADSADWIALPTEFDIHEYAIMERFCDSLDDGKIREDLGRALTGRGAFRRFKDAIHRHGIADDWYRYRDQALRDIAAEWCETHDIAHEAPAPDTAGDAAPAHATQPASGTTVASLRLRILDGGHMRLDGGTMFGVVPRANWAKLVPPDDENRIKLACWCVLAEIGDRRVLIETGMGNKYSEKERRIYGLTGEWVGPSLEAIGVSPASIDLVVLTHLHFDHAGALTRFADASSGAGDQTLVFPNAEVVVQRGEWQDAFDNYSTTKSSYRPEELQPVKDAGRLRLIEGSIEVADGVSVRVTPGHTRHHQSVILAGPKRTACFVGELLPTIHHARPSYQMAYDLMPMETMRQKATLMEEAEANDWLLLLDHDPDHPVVTVARNERGRFLLQDHAASDRVLGDWLEL